MQNLKEGDSVSLQGKIATVLQVGPYTVQLQLEDGTTLWSAKANVQPRSFLIEIENDGKNIL